MPEERGILIIVAKRGGSIAEVTSFLSDLEEAYIALYSFHRLWLPERLLDRLPSRLWLELGYPNAVFGHTGFTPLTADRVPPDARISLERVKIESPGIWEFAASLTRRIHGCRSLTVDFTRAWAGVRRFSAPGVEVVSVGVRG